MTDERTLVLKCALVAKAAFDHSIVAGFEARFGWRLAIVWAPTTVIMAQLAAGETADAVLLVSDAVASLESAGKVAAGTGRTVLHSRIGVAVAKGARHPDIATVEAFARAMTEARAVCYSRGGASGLHFAPMMERLGIAEAVNARAVIIPAGFTAETLVSGEADIAIQQLSELACVAGVEIVGPLPDGVQKVGSFSAAVMTGSVQRAMAQRFVAYLGSDDAVAAYRATWLDPA